MPPDIPTQAVVYAKAAAGGPEGARTLTARLATYEQIINPHSPYGGMRLKIGAIAEPDALADVKLQLHHDDHRIIGVMTDFEMDADGIIGTFRLASTQDASEAYQLARDGILDAVSMGFFIHDAAYATVDGNDVLDVSRAELFEVSLVARGADKTARISALARKAPAVTVPATEASVEAAAAAAAADPTPELMEKVLARVRSEMAPAAAAPITAPSGEITRARLVDGNGQPIALATDRRDTRIPAAFGRDGKPYTAGDYFAAYARGINEGDWTRHNEVRAALADELTSDVPGLLPQAIVGELLGRASGRRPVWDSLTERAMPMVGEKFSRPRITQHVAVDVQTAQKTEVASQKYTVALDDVTKSTLAGALDVAQQALDWTSPSLLNELIIDFTRIYVARTDQMAATDLVAAATAGAQTVAWDGTAAALTTALAEAAGLVYSNAPAEADAFPNTIWISVDVWVMLAGLTDADGRPLLPQLAPSNATGTTDLSNPEAGISGPGFRWVISKRLPAGTFIMGDREYTESYENGRRFLQAVRPDVLGLDIAYMGYVADYFPYPATLVTITVPAAP